MAIEYKTFCPACGYFVDHASDLANMKKSPIEGDFSLCLSCGAVLRFDKELKLLKAPPEDLALLFPEQRAMVIKAQEIIRARGPIKRKETKQ